MASKKEYQVRAEGFIHGEHRKKNAKLELTDREAKYLVQSGLIEETPKPEDAPLERKEPDPATLERKTR